MSNVIRCVPFKIMVDWDNSGKFVPLRHPFKINGNYLPNRILYYKSMEDAKKAYSEMPLSSCINAPSVHYEQIKQSMLLLDLGHVCIQITPSMF